MSGPFRAPGEPGRIARIAQDERFLRGLGLGALIGAAIAGSTLWNRVRDARRPDDPHAGAPSHEGPTVSR